MIEIYFRKCLLLQRQILKCARRMIVHYTSLYTVPFGVLIFLFLIYVIKIIRDFYICTYIHYIKLSLGNIQIRMTEKIIIGYHMVLIFVLIFTGFISVNISGVFFAVIISLGIPIIIVKRLKRKYVNNLVEQLPDVMSAMSAMLRSGAHISKAFHLVAEQNTSPISHEFMIVLSESKMGKDFNEAINSMALRVSREEMDLFAAAINLASTVGGNLAETLDILSDTLREKMTIEGKIIAITAMGRLQGKLISLLPFGALGILFYQDPELLGVIYRHPDAWFAIVALCAVIALASIMIHRITNIKV